MATETGGLNIDQATTTFVLPTARVFEFGGGVTFRGTVDLENPLQSMVDDRTATDPFIGGVRVTGGVRVRF